MSDAWELTLAVRLRDDLTDGELVDLRWHLGIGPQPEHFAIVTSFPFVVVDDDGTPEVVDAPRPFLAERGPAWKVGGTLTADLVRRPDRPGWEVTARQELHPDSLDEARPLLNWLARHTDGETGDVVGYLRSYEEDEPSPLTVVDSAIAGL